MWSNESQENLMSQKPHEEHFQNEDVASSVQWCREGQSDQDQTKHNGLSHRGDADYRSESWVSGVVGMEARLKLSSDRVS